MDEAVPLTAVGAALVVAARLLDRDGRSVPVVGPVTVGGTVVMGAGGTARALGGAIDRAGAVRRAPSR